MAWDVAYTPVLYAPPATGPRAAHPVTPSPRHPFTASLLPWIPATWPAMVDRPSPRKALPDVGDQTAAYRDHHYLEARGKYRVFNAAEYWFYRSNTGPPAETDSPFATSSSLPHEPADTYADGTWWLSVQWFNGCLPSGFLPLGPRGETYLRLDLAAGVEAGGPPAGPQDWQLVARAGGVVEVGGFYFETGSLRADQWAIAYTTNGSTPAADTPDVTVDMSNSQLAVLDYDLPAAPHGTEVKVRLQTRRNDGTDLSPVWVYSEDSTVKTLAADAVGPHAARSGESWPGPIPEPPR